MSETVKLIIEIPKEVYEYIKNISHLTAYSPFEIIANGIPLDDVKAEIQASMYCDKDTRLVENANASGLKKALEIIDKHISGEGDRAFDNMFANVTDINTKVDISDWDVQIEGDKG